MSLLEVPSLVPTTPKIGGETSESLGRLPCGGRHLQSFIRVWNRTSAAFILGHGPETCSSSFPAQLGWKSGLSPAAPAGDAEDREGVFHQETTSMRKPKRIGRIFYQIGPGFLHRGDSALVDRVPLLPPEGPHFSSKSGVRDFCSCKLSILDTHPSLDSGFSGRCAEPVMSCSPAYLATKRRAATPEAARLTMSVCSLRQSRSREASDQGSHEGHADSPFGSDHAD
jgi:hypothetical protein